jgi:hypothetical protein
MAKLLHTARKSSIFIKVSTSCGGLQRLMFNLKPIKTQLWQNKHSSL